MSSLANEEILMTSNDKSVTLTTHRVIQRDNQMTKEIFLKDVTSHEIIKKRGSYYFVLAVIFFIPTIILLFLWSQNESPFNDMTDENKKFLIGAPAFLTILAAYYAMTSYKRFLKISGRFNEIEFSIKSFNEQALNKFINRLITESENRKKEE